jgi:hypothetical protein
VKICISKKKKKLNGRLHEFRYTCARRLFVCSAIHTPIPRSHVARVMVQMYNATGSLDASAPTSCRDMVPSGAVFRGDPPGPAAGPRDGGGGGDGYENRALIPLFLASALLFFVTYQLFGLAAAGGVVALFVVLALAAHRVRLSRAFPFLHLSWDVAPGGGVLFRPRAAAGMDAAAISALPAAFGYKRDEHAATGWAQCAICLGLVRAGEAVRRLPACGHLFHAGCVDKWLRAHATCPLCRAAVAPELPI